MSVSHVLDIQWKKLLAQPELVRHLISVRPTQAMTPKNPFETINQFPVTSVAAMQICCDEAYLGRILKVVHGRIVNTLARCSFCCLNKVSQSRGHILHSIDQHHLLHQCDQHHK